jgi:vanillate O-demethylase monooxygenase subunit
MLQHAAEGSRRRSSPLFGILNNLFRDGNLSRRAAFLNYDLERRTGVAFLTNTWYVAAWDQELAGGKLLARTILEKPVLLYKGDSGRVVALDNRCCHRGAKLSNGRREGDDVRCMYHGLKFDPSGKCIQIPGQDNIPKNLGVKSYPVLERDRLVWIWMGDSALADPRKILDFPYLRDPAWRGRPDYMHYKANYLLIVDNLSDFAHLAFVHTKTLGGSEEYAYKSKPTAIERLEDGFRVERWHLGADAPPFHKKVVPHAGKVDRRNIARMYVPGIFFMETLFSPAGAGAREGNLEGAKQYRNCQFFTPETQRSTHFFWDYLHDYDLDNPAYRRFAARQHGRGLHGGQVHHRGPAGDARRRSGFPDERHRRRRALGAFQKDPRKNDRRGKDHSIVCSGDRTCLSSPSRRISACTNGSPRRRATSRRRDSTTSSTASSRTTLRPTRSAPSRTSRRAATPT